MFGTKSSSKKSDAQQVLADLSRRGNANRVERLDGRHLEGRADLSLGVLIVPLANESPDIGRAFTAMTRDVSATGIGVVANRAIPTSEALLRLAGNSETRLLRTTVRNRKELGEGWVRFDMEVTEVLDRSEYPQLKQFVGSIMA